MLAPFLKDAAAAGGAQPAVTGEIALQTFDVARPVGQSLDGLPQPLARLGRECFDVLLDLGCDPDLSFHPGRKRPSCARISDPAL